MSPFVFKLFVCGDLAGTLDIGKVVRIGRIHSEEGKIASDLHHLCLETLSREAEGDACNTKAKKRRRNWEEHHIQDAVQVICGTCNGFAANYMDSYVFSRLIIDEAGQASEPETISPISRVHEEGQIVLVGDHMQLRPHVTDRTASFAGLDTSLFERLSSGVPGITKCFLDTQYRMAPSLSKWPNTEFYQGKLRDGVSATFDCNVGGFPWPAGSAQVFIHCAGIESESASGSFKNSEQAEIVATLVKRCLAAGSVDACEVGILSWYEAQRRDLIILGMRNEIKSANGSMQKLLYVTPRRQLQSHVCARQSKPLLSSGILQTSSDTHVAVKRTKENSTKNS